MTNGFFAGFVAIPFILPLIASAHPLAQGRMDVVIYRDKITLWARVSVEQVVVQQSLPTNDDGVIVTQSDAYRVHGKYLLKHVYLSADGKRLEGRVIAVQEPDNKTLVPGDPGKEYAIYEIEYIPSTVPAAIELREDVLLEVEFTPGNPWQSTYITGIRQEQSLGQENLLLTSSNTLKYTCNWSAAPAPTPAQTVPKTTEKPDAVPETIKRPIPETAPDRTHFIAGVAIGLCAIYLLAVLVRKFRHKE